MQKLISALVKAQKDIKNAEKDAKNPHLKNSYATLESVIDSVKEIANSNGLAIVQTNGRDEKGDFVETTIFHESGEKIDSRCYLEIEKKNMQGMGSAITYARRYSLAAIFCITQSDDDGNRTKKTVDDSKFKEPKEDLGKFVINYGQSKGLTFDEAGALKVNGLLNWFLGELEKKKEQPSGDVKLFIDNAREFLRGAAV